MWIRRNIWRLIFFAKWQTEKPNITAEVELDVPRKEKIAKLCDNWKIYIKEIVIFMISVNI